MRIWLALLLAPTLALATQSILFSLVTPSCGAQTAAMLHIVGAIALVLALWFTLLARTEWQAVGRLAVDGPDSIAGDRSSRQRFLAVAATAVGGLSSLVILMMWFAAWVLSPCWQ